MPTITIVNAQTGEVEIREMNTDETKQFELDQQKAILESQQKEELLARKESLLKKLGITEEDARLLLG